MTIWMDLTNSLEDWQGGVVGIVRAELEIAKNLHSIDSNIKFCVCTGNTFKEVDIHSLEWLWNADSVGDAYCRHFTRGKYKDKTSEVQNEAYEKFLNKNLGLLAVQRAIPSKLIRVKRLGYLFLESLPFHFGKIFEIPAKFVFNLASQYFCRKNNQIRVEQKKSEISTFDTSMFKDGDVLFSCGWITTNKESVLSTIKRTVGLRVVYLVYDIILIKEDLKHLFGGADLFERYLRWISENCEMVLYGGQTAQNDTEEYFKKNNLPVPEGCWVKFGDEIVSYQSEDKHDRPVLNRYILSVGSFEPRKNYKTLYDAYCILTEKYPLSEIPDLVIVGKEYADADLASMYKRHPLIKQKVKIIQPTDSELRDLYINCEFTVLPTLYEGWSLTLPESLNYSKFCLCSDVAPLREIGQDLVRYVPTLSASKWAEEIMNLFNDPSTVFRYEQRIKKEWRSTSWKDCALSVFDKLKKVSVNSAPRKDAKCLYYDLTLAAFSALNQAPVSGILRTQLLLARELAKKVTNIKFFSLLDGYCEYSRLDLMHILSNQEIDKALKEDSYAICNKLRQTNPDYMLTGVIHNSNSREMFWLFVSLFSPMTQIKLVTWVRRRILSQNISDKSTETKKPLILPFNQGDIVFESGFCNWTNEIFLQTTKLHKDKKFIFIQLIYDYTTVVVPQTHQEETVEWYERFLENTNELSDAIFYGGKTASEDGEKYQKQHLWSVKPFHVVKFGGDVVRVKLDKRSDKEILRSLGIDSSYILTVGSIEARKNHETLYRAYLTLLSKGITDLPKLVICGYPGWKTTDFLTRLDRDDRVKNYIVHFTVSDDKLDVLYRNCLFTLLPSFYEGWSLTLPESLKYGKFSIVSDVAPLREIGKDFVEYVQPVDCEKWGEKLYYYYKNPDLVKQKEAFIQKFWEPISWEDCANDLLVTFKKIGSQDYKFFANGQEL